MPSTTPSTSTHPPSSPTTLAPETLETDLLTHLASTAALEDLHASLLSSLQRLGWTEKIRKLSQELLRAGRCESFDAVVETIVASAAGLKQPVRRSDDDGFADGEADDDADAYAHAVDVRIPKAVVEQGVRAIKEVLCEVVVLEVEDDPALPSSSVHTERAGNLSLDVETEKSKPSKTSTAREHSLKNTGPGPAKKVGKKPRPGKHIK